MAQTAKPAPASPQTLAPGWYHLEVKTTSPRSCITFGGQTFHRVTYKPRQLDDSPTTTIYDVEIKGQDVYLTETELGHLKAARGKKVLRVVSERSGRSQIHRVGSSRYRKMPKDTPLEDHIILRPIDKPQEEEQDTESAL